MTRLSLLAECKIRIQGGRVLWGTRKLSDAEKIALLAYWPQLLRGRKHLDANEARTFLASVGFFTMDAPKYIEELGLKLVEGSEMGWSHPLGDGFGAQLATDILEGRMTIAAAVAAASEDQRRIDHEKAVFTTGDEVSPGKFTHQNTHRR